MILALTTLLCAASLQEPVPFPYHRWEAAAGSRAGFEGDSTLHAFSGEAKPVQALLHADLTRLGATAGGDVWFLVKDLSTGKEDRDENMMGDLEAERFPRIRFRLDGLTGELGAAGSSSLDASGSFSIHGIEQPRLFPVTLERLADGALRVQGELKFLHTDHGIQPHSTFGLVKVHDEVNVWFDLTLQPVAGAPRSGTVAALSVKETVRIPGEPEKATESAWSLWSAGAEALLTSPGEWWLAGASGAVLRLDPRAGAPAAVLPPVEESFLAARARLTSLQEKLAAMAPEQRAKAGAKMEQTIARLEATLATAPAAGPAEVLRAEDRVEIRLGGVSWAVLEGLQGAARMPAALSALPELPAAVREALSGLEGTPGRAWLRTASPAGVREIEIHFGAPAAAAIPAWALEPKSWSPVTA